VALPLRLQSATTDGVDDLLESLDVAALADRFPGEVSLGEQQRAAIARALVLQPPLMVLDEPTASRAD
jgi:putative ABC transport system ATP-binding protein